MIQDIFPHIYDNQTKEKPIQNGDMIFFFRENQVMLKENQEVYCYEDIQSVILNESFSTEHLRYCFNIDNKQVYIVDEVFHLQGEWQRVSVFRSIRPSYLGFVLITAYQLWLWHHNNHYCGHCGNKMDDSNKERAKICSNCGHIVYPTISPAIIVAITDKNRILLAKNVNSHTNNHALIAGYCEIGETLEETVHREVMEEVGLKIKNLRYYKSQPWSYSGSLLMGFFADLDGSDEIVLQKEELSEATWFDRSQLQKREVLDSLTSEMIDCFRENRF